MALQLSRRSGPSPPHGIVMPNPNSPRSPAEPASRQVGAARTASPRARAHLIGPGLDTRGGQNSPRNNRNPYATLARMTKTEAPAETVAPSPRGSRDPVRTLASSTASTADSIPVGHVGPDPAKGDSTPAVHPAAAPVRTDPPQRRTGVHASPRQHPNTLAARKSNKIGEVKQCINRLSWDIGHGFTETLAADATLLFVDDSTVACIAGRRVFEQMGFETHVKLGGVEALDFVAGSDPSHVVVLDLQMPQVDGRALLRVLKENRRWRHVPVIAITSTNPSVQSKAELMRMGAYAVAKKPIQRATLDPLIQSAMKDMMGNPQHEDDEETEAEAAANLRSSAVVQQQQQQQQASFDANEAKLKAMSQPRDDDDVQCVLRQLKLQQRMMVQNGTIERQRQHMGDLQSSKHAILFEYAATTGTIPQSMLRLEGANGRMAAGMSNTVEFQALEEKIDAIFEQCGGDSLVAGTRECDICLRNLAVIVCEFPAYFAPCLLFRIAGDGNWQRISTGVFNSPVSQKVHGLPTSTSTRSLQRKPRVFLRKEDFVSFWRDHVYGRGRRQRLCSLLRHYDKTRTCGTQRICTAALRVLIRGLVKWHPDLSSLRNAEPDTEVRVKHYVSMVIATMQASISRSAACITTSDILNSNLVDSFYMVQDFLTSAFELLSITRFEAAHQVWKEMLEHERGGAALKKTRLGDGRLKCGCGDHTVAESNWVDEEYVTMDNKSLRSRLRLNEAVLERIFAGYAKTLASAYEQSIGFEDLVYICFAVEDEMRGTSVTFWFRCLDLDASGYLSPNSVYHFIKSRDEVRTFKERRGVGGETYQCRVHDHGASAPPVTPAVQVGRLSEHPDVPTVSLPDSSPLSSPRARVRRMSVDSQRTVEKGGRVDSLRQYNVNALKPLGRPQHLERLTGMRTATMGEGDAHAGVSYSRMAALLIEQVAPESYATGPSQRTLRKARGGTSIFHHLVRE